MNDGPPSLTLIEFLDLLFADKDDKDEPVSATCALYGVLALMRSALQGEIATNEGIACSMKEWVRQNGTPTWDKVYAWVRKYDETAHLPIPYSYIKDVMDAD